MFAPPSGAPSLSAVSGRVVTARPPPMPSPVAPMPRPARAPAPDVAPVPPVAAPVEPPVTARPPPARSSNWLPWLLLILAAGGAGAFAARQYLPLLQRQAALRGQQQQTEQQLAAARTSLALATEQLGTATKQRDEWSREFSAARQAARESEDAREKVRRDLDGSLAEELATGEVQVSARDGAAVVSIEDRLLFTTGTVQLTASGKHVLQQVAAALAPWPDRPLRVGGYTESKAVVAPVIRHLYPTEWELSAARATQVLLFLQDQCSVSPARLDLAAFADQHPMLGEDGRPKTKGNGRIELTMLAHGAASKPPGAAGGAR
jgi:chemotaxis protein MotB